MPASPKRIESFVVQNDSYESGHGEFAQRRAATAAQQQHCGAAGLGVEEVPNRGGEVARPCRAARGRRSPRRCIGSVATQDSAPNRALIVAIQGTTQRCVVRGGCRKNVKVVGASGCRWAERRMLCSRSTGSLPEPSTQGLNRGFLSL